MKMIKKTLAVLTAAGMLLASGCSLLGGECTHEKHSKVAAVASTCILQGNREYWLCDSCCKYFADEACTEEITYEETILPLASHTFGEGLYCELEGCKSEKPYTSTLEGHTYYVYSFNTVCDFDETTPEQSDALSNVFNDYYNSAREGSYYSFEEGGVVNGKHFIRHESTQDTAEWTEEVSFAGTYTTEGDSFTISREDGGEVYSMTYSLDEYGRWICAEEIDKAQVEGYEGAKIEVMLQEQVDHLLRCKEGIGTRYTLGICDYCGGEQPRPIEAVGTTWKITAVEFAYPDGVTTSAEVDSFVQSYFASFMNTTYTLNEGGTVTSTNAGGAKDWVQYGDCVELYICIGADDSGQPIYWRAWCTMEDCKTMKVSYVFSETEKAQLPETYRTYAAAMLTLTLLP